MTVVRIAVARFESMPATPTLASRAVAAANVAESRAQTIQLEDAVSIDLPRARLLHLHRVEVDQLPLALFHAGADLRGRLAQLGLLIGVDRLLHAGGALGAVGSFKAA